MVLVNHHVRVETSLCDAWELKVLLQHCNFNVALPLLLQALDGARPHLLRLLAKVPSHSQLATALAAEDGRERLAAIDVYFPSMDGAIANDHAWPHTTVLKQATAEKYTLEFWNVRSNNYNEKHTKHKLSTHQYNKCT